MKKKRETYIVEGLEVTDITAEGKAVARDNGMVLFIDGAVPGDVVDVEVRRKKKSFAEGVVHQLRAPSPQRVSPVCQHFGTCGGCKWQHLSYEAQLQFKERQVGEAFNRIGHLNITNISPIIGNAHAYFYRNKLEFTFSNKKWLTSEQLNDSTITYNRDALGFHIPGMFDKILDIDECHLQAGASNTIRNQVREYASENKLTFFDIRQQVGFLRTLMIRTTSTGETMVLVAVFEWLEKELFDLLQWMKTTFPSITTIVYTHNHKKNDSLDGLEIKTFSGVGFITEEMEGLKFRISPRSFYQTNSEQALQLYRVTRDFCNLQGHETVYDLYTGTGTIANFVSRNCKKVVGVEYVEDAVRDAHVNSAINNIGNTSFFAGDLKDVLNDEFVITHGHPDVIITDPPRAGMHEDVVKTILKIAPEKIVYVSCNPSTQARDLAIMSVDYEIAAVQPVDMFPQTSHVENVTLLVKRF